MQELAHRVEVLAETARLRARESQGPRHLLLVQLEQLSNGDGCAEDARRRSRMPAPCFEDDYLSPVKPLHDRTLQHSDSMRLCRK